MIAGRAHDLITRRSKIDRSEDIAMVLFSSLKQSYKGLLLQISKHRKERRTQWAFAINLAQSMEHCTGPRMFIGLSQSSGRIVGLLFLVQHG